jgi:hypothetical protein
MLKRDAVLITVATVAPACLSGVACQSSGVDTREVASAPIAVSASERLYVASISLRKLDQIYVAESQRLERVCPPPRPSEDTCRSSNVSTGWRRCTRVPT